MTPIEPFAAADLTAHVDWVRRVARALTKDDRAAFSAHDLEQETWLSALRHPPQRPPRHGEELRRWLAAVARNVLRKLARGESRRQRHLAVAAEELQRTGDGAAPGSDLLVARAQLQQRVAAAVLSLAEPYRSTLLARYFEDLPPSAIAAKFGVPVDTVKTRLQRGLGQLRAELQTELGDEASGEAASGDGSGSLLAALALLDAPIERWLPDLAPPVGPSGSQPEPSSASSSATTSGALATAAGPSTPWLIGALLLASGATMAWVMRGAARGDSPRFGDPSVAVAGITSLTTTATSEAADPAALVVAPAAMRVESAALPAPIAPITAGSIRGVVVGPDGEPVGGATLWAGRQSSDRFADENAFHRSVSSLLSSGGDPRYLQWRVTTSADDGSFAFAELEPAGCFAIGALHDPTGCGWLGGLVLDEQTVELEAFVELEPGVVIHGRVLDPDGAPVPHAGVMFDGSTRPWAENVDRLGGSWSCDAQGRYRTVPFPWRYVQAYVGNDDWESGTKFQSIVTEVLALPESAAEWERDFVLQPTPHLEGTLVGLDGESASLATTLLPLLTAGERLRQSRETVALIAFATDPRVDPSCIERVALADGTSRGGTPSGWEYGTLDFDHDRYRLVLHQTALRWLALVARDRWLGVVELPVDGSAPALPIDVARLPSAPRMVELTVRTRDGSGAPLDQVSLRAMNLGFDERGHRSFDQVMLRPLGTPVAPGALPIDEPADQLVALLPGEWWIEAVRTQLAGRWTRVSLTEGMAPLDWTLAFEPDRGALEGAVVDGNGATIAGAALRLYRVEGCEPIESYGAVPGVTDPSGRFVVRNLPEVAAWLVAEAEGFAPRALRVDLAAAGTAVEARLMEGHSMVVHLERVDGADVRFTRWQLFDAEGVPLLDDDFPFAQPHRYGAVARVRLAEGNYRLVVRGPGDVRGEAAFTAAEGGAVTVRLE